MRNRIICCLSVALMLSIGATAAWANTVWEGRIGSGTDDIEEHLPAGNMDITSTDLEMPHENTGQNSPQIVGLRFLNVDVPQGSAVTNAYIEFVVDELKDSSLAASLVIEGELSPNAAVLATTANNLSDRVTTAAQVVWPAANWTAAGQADQTSNIAGIIEEIVGQAGWARGSALVLMIRDNPDNPSAGVRAAESYDGDSSAAPLLHIEWGPAVKATASIPSDGEVEVLRDTILGWSPSAFAASHNVYFGSVFDDVNSADTANPLGVLASQGQMGTTFDPGRLDFSQTYYWRVDEVNAAPDFSVFKGDVWRLTTESFTYPIASISATASSMNAPDMGPENTVNGSGLNAQDQHGTSASDMWLTSPTDTDRWIQYEFDKAYKIHEMSIWNQNQAIESIIGFGTKEVTIEISLDGTNWSTLEGVSELNQATGGADYSANTIVDFGARMAKFVRLTINSGWGLLPQSGLSEVRFTSIPVYARNPVPGDGATIASVNTTLAWRPGREAANHEVWLDADRAAVFNGSAAVNVTEQSSFSPSPLLYSSTYYWRVDETNDVGVPPRYEGEIWSFNAPEYLAIDDFESYTDKEPLEIWATWADGFGDEANNGAIVGNGNEGERSIVSEGNQSMPIHFDNASSAISEVTRMFSPPLSFTTGEPEALVLDVRGDAPAFAEDADGNIIISAAGADIWDTADEFRFAYRQLSGDGSITARVNSQTVVHDWSKAGVMIRESASPESANAYLPISGVNGVRFQARTATFIASVNDDAALDGVQQNIARDEPVWLRIERAGNTFTGYYSLEETPSNWTTLGVTHTVPMVANVLIGLAVTSHSVGNTVVANISDVSTTGNVSGSWTVEAIGGTHAAGNDADAMYVRVTSGNQSRTFTHPNPAITQAVVWDSWIIPIAEIGLSSADLITVGVGTPGGSPSGAVGTAYVDWLRVGTPLPIVPDPNE